MFPLTHLGGQLLPLPSILYILIDLATVVAIIASKDDEGILVVNDGWIPKSLR